MDVLPTNKALERIKTGVSLDGRQIDAQKVFASLAKSRPRGSPWQILNAALGPFRVDCAAFQDGIILNECALDGYAVFSECTFKQTEFRGCTFSGFTSIENSLFDGRFIIENCVFSERLRMEVCRACRDVEISSSTFASPPWVNHVDFLDRLEWRKNTGNWAHSATWEFRTCAFGGRSYLDMPQAPTELEFALCTFEPRSLVDIRWSREAKSVRCRFPGSSVFGRVVLRQTSGGQVSNARDGAAGISFDRAMIAGDIDLRGLPLHWISLQKATVNGGQIRFPRESVGDPRSWTSWKSAFDWAAADRCGVVLEERQMFGETPPTSTYVGPEGLGAEATERPDDSARPLHSIAHQYEDLRNSFVRIPATDWEEDFCHYKCMDYRRRDAVHRQLDQASVKAARRIAAAFTCVAVLLYSLSWISCACSSTFFSTLLFASAAVTALLVPLAMACVFPGRFRTAVRLWWDWAVLKWTIGYGVYAHRVLVAAVGVILFFALAYASCIYLAPGMGDISDGSITNGSIRDGHPIEVIRRLVYFSGVTFTTLGYGDYRPTEWIQLVVVAESLLGAVTIALVVVVFARKFIRR